MELVKKYAAHIIVAIIVLAMLVMLTANRLTATRQDAERRLTAAQVPELSFSVPLSAVGENGQPGSASVTQTDGKTTIDIGIAPGHAGDMQPAAIRRGGCGEAGDEKFPLSPVVDGASRTVFAMPFDVIVAGERLVVEVRRVTVQGVEASSCGELSIGG